MNNEYADLIACRLKLCRQEAGETLDQIGKLTGVDKSTVMRWEKGMTGRINLPTLHLLARHYNVNPAWLSGDPDASRHSSGNWLRDAVLPREDMVYIPILRSARAGFGGAILEETIGYEPTLHESGRDRDTCFWLKMSEDNMSPVINQNDMVLVHRQTTADDHVFAVVLINEENAIVAKVISGDGFVELHSVNPYYPPRRFEGKELSQVRIMGIVMESRRKFWHE